MQETEQIEIQTAVNVSAENARKLDKLIFLLEGSPDNPGLIHRINNHDVLLFGRDGEQGLIQRVNIMWRVHMWLLCSLSALAGFAIKAIGELVFK